MNASGHQLLSFRKWMGFPGGASGTEPACQCRRHKKQGFNPWVGKIPWRSAWQPTPVFLPRESHGQRSLAGCSPQSYKSDTTERLSTHARYDVSPSTFAEIRKLGPRAKHGLLPVFVNKVLLEHSQAYSCTYCLWVLSCNNGRVE